MYLSDNYYNIIFEIFSEHNSVFTWVKLYQTLLLTINLNINFILTRKLVK